MRALLYQNDVTNAERISTTETSKRSPLMYRFAVGGECDDDESMHQRAGKSRSPSTRSDRMTNVTVSVMMSPHAARPGRCSAAGQLEQEVSCLVLPLS